MAMAMAMNRTPHEAELLLRFAKERVHPSELDRKVAEHLAAEKAAVFHKELCPECGTDRNCYCLTGPSDCGVLCADCKLHGQQP